MALEIIPHTISAADYKRAAHFVSSTSFFASGDFMQKVKLTVAQTAAEMAAHRFDSSQYLSLSPVSVEQKFRPISANNPEKKEAQPAKDEIKP